MNFIIILTSIQVHGQVKFFKKIYDEIFPISGERAQMWLSSTSDSTCNSLDSNCAKILSESESSMTYEELLDSNTDIKLNSSEENSIELFISGVTASHDLADLTVSNFLWKVYCCKDGECQRIMRATIHFVNSQVRS